MPDSKTPCAGNLTVKTTFVIKQEKPYNAPVQQEGITSNQLSASLLRRAMILPRWFLWLWPLAFLHSFLAHSPKNGTSQKAAITTKQERPREDDGCIEINAGYVNFDMANGPISQLCDALKEYPAAPSFHVTWMVPIPLGTVYCSVRYFRVKRMLRCASEEHCDERPHVDYRRTLYTHVTDESIQKACQVVSMGHSQRTDHSDGFADLPDVGCTEHDLLTH